MTCIVLYFAFYNVFTMHRLGINRKLIILLYVTCIMREVFGCIVVLMFAIRSSIEIVLDDQLNRWLTTVFDFFDAGVQVTCLLTIYHLATSMQLVQDLITEE